LPAAVPAEFRRWHADLATFAFAFEQLRLAAVFPRPPNGQRKPDSRALILPQRHGVALFHDIYGNALSALPKVFASLGRVIVWHDCHQLARL
jgi:hypothetical protein